MNDQKLILATLRGKLGAFEIIVKRYQKPIYSHALRLLKDHDAAEDAVQETFVRAYENLARFKIDKPLKPWLFRITTNYSFDYWRKNSRLTKLPENILEKEATPLEKIIQAEEKETLNRALRKLPEIYRRPIFGYYFSNLNYQMLAQNLKIPLNTVRTRLKRGKIILAKLMANY